MITIRKAVFDDLNQIVAVEKECFQTPWPDVALGVELAANETARYFVAEDQNDIIGYGGMWVVVGEAHITNLAVAPHYRKQGVGRLILDKLLEIARDERCSAATLEVRIGNIPARRLYESSGFAPVGIRPGYYSDINEDALVMWCVLD